MIFTGRICRGFRPSDRIGFPFFFLSAFLHSALLTAQATLPPGPREVHAGFFFLMGEKHELIIHDGFDTRESRPAHGGRKIPPAPFGGLGGFKKLFSS
jgi:hypothetical protein